MDLQNAIKHQGAKAVINDNAQFHEWLICTVTIEDAVRRCPNLMVELLEEYNNDWIEAVEEEAGQMGITLGDDFEVVEDEDYDEDDFDDEDDDYEDEEDDGDL